PFGAPLPRATPPKSHRRWASRSLLIRLRQPNPIRQAVSRGSDAGTTTGTEALQGASAVMRAKPYGPLVGMCFGHLAAPAQSSRAQVMCCDLASAQCGAG